MGVAGIKMDGPPKWENKKRSVGGVGWGRVL